MANQRMTTHRSLKPKKKDSLAEVLNDLYPDYTKGEQQLMQDKIDAFIAKGLSDGYDIALLKNVGDSVRLRVFKLIEEEEE